MQLLYSLSHTHTYADKSHMSSIGIANVSQIALSHVIYLHDASVQLWKTSSFCFASHCLRLFEQLFASVSIWMAYIKTAHDVKNPDRSN